MRDGRLEEIDLMTLLRDKRLYLAMGVLVSGILLNNLSQYYLHQYVNGNDGHHLPKLSDLILDNIPYWDIAIIYDIFSIVSLLIFIAYVVKYATYHQVPYYLILIGAFHTVRALFIILTPFGNPPMFDGTEGPFNGFSNYEIGVYPSGHTGVSYLYFLMVEKPHFRYWLFISFAIIVGALFLSRGHYSIDILSGVFFAYAIKSFFDKHYRQQLIIKS